MRFGRSILVLLLVAVLSSLVNAQGSAKVVKIDTGGSVYRIKKGSLAKITVTLEVDAGYHINSNRPNDKNLIATALVIDKTTGIKTTAVRYPRAKLRKFPFSPKPLSVYEGKVQLLFNASALPSASAGSLEIHGKLKVQACNEEVCLRPQTVDVKIPVEIF